MSKLNPSCTAPEATAFEAAGNNAAAAREKHFPRWQRLVAAATLATGVALLVASMALTRPAGLSGADALALADFCYMAGFVLVLLELLYLPWVAIHMPAAPARAVPVRESTFTPSQPNTL